MTRLQIAGSMEENYLKCKCKYSYRYVRNGGCERGYNGIMVTTSHQMMQQQGAIPTSGFHGIAKQGRRQARDGGGAQTTSYQDDAL